MKTKTKKKTKKKVAIHKRIHRHVKKHLDKLKKKRPRTHKVVILMSITLPVVLGTLLFGSSALYVYENYFDLSGQNEKEKITVNLPVVEDDTLKWKTYQDELSGFSIKYPDYWGDGGQSDSGDKQQKYLKRILLDNGLDSHAEEYNGLVLFVYDAKKYPGPVGTDNLVVKNPATFAQENCDKAEFWQATLGEEGYPSQEVDVSRDDQCFSETYFFSLTRGDYTYNIVPLVGNLSSPLGKGMKANIIARFPKFFEITSTIVLPKAEEKEVAVPSSASVKKAVPPKTEPRRVLKSMGRCRHKNDKPRKSKTKKHRHMDEDCCMDPDEWPNPRCQY